MTQVWIAEYRTEENPGIDYPAFDAIQRLTRQVWPQTPNSFALNLVKAECPGCEAKDGFMVTEARRETDALIQRVFIVDEMISESPWYEEANRMLRLMDRTWRFRLPDNNGENPYEVAIRLYHFSDKELKNDSLLEEEQKPHASSPSRSIKTDPRPLRGVVGEPQAAGGSTTIPGDRGQPVPLPDPSVPPVPGGEVSPGGTPTSDPKIGDWDGDRFLGEGAPTSWDYLYKDFLCLVEPQQYKKTEEFMTGDDDFGDKNYGRLQILSRILGGWMTSAEDADETEPMLYAIAEKFGMVPPPNWSYGQ